MENKRNLIGIFMIVSCAFYLVFWFYQKENSMISYSSSIESSHEYYKLWVNNKDPLKDSFLDQIEALAKQHNIKRVHAQDMTALDQSTALYQVKYGEPIRRVTSEEPTKALKAFFNESIYTPEEAEYGIAKEEDITFSFQEIVLANLMADEPDQVDEEDLNYNMISFRFYMRNNEKIKLDMDIQRIPSLIPKYFIVTDHIGNTVEPTMTDTTIISSKLFIGGRSKGVVTYTLPNDVYMEDLILQSKITNKSIPFKRLNHQEVIDLKKQFDF